MSPKGQVSTYSKEVQPGFQFEPLGVLAGVFAGVQKSWLPPVKLSHDRDFAGNLLLIGVLYPVFPSPLPKDPSQITPEPLAQPKVPRVTR